MQREITMKPLASFFMKIKARPEAVTLKKSAPSWLSDAIQEAHQGDFPGDWIYSECLAACEAIDSGDLTEDSIHEHADSRVDVYTKDLAKWYAEFCLSSTSTFSAAEERADELGTEGSINDRLMRIQYCAAAFIAETILGAVNAQAKAA